MSVSGHLFSSNLLTFIIYYGMLYKMSTNIRNTHPCIRHHDVYAQVCSPLERIGVNFFGYTAVDANNRAYCLGSQANYAERYLENEHEKKDVHFFEDSNSQKPSYFFWDHADLSKDEKAVYGLAHEHQQGHTLTIIKHTPTMTHCYHFSGHIHDTNINQRFLSKLDYLHSFMDYFDHSLANVPELSSVYDHPINVEHKKTNQDFIIIRDDPRALQLEAATTHLRFKNFSNYYLTDKERTCLYWLQNGKSSPMIAQILNVSVKSIERHFASIKRKYECYTLYQLGQKIAISGLDELLDRSR